MADGIWLEVSKVRIEGNEVSVQLRGDQRDDGPDWWQVGGSALGADNGPPSYNAIAAGLDHDNRVVIAKLGPDDELGLACTRIRVQTT